MTLDRWILLVLAVLTALQTVGVRIFDFGRWAQKTETDTAAKPKVTLERLSWDIESIGKDIKDLRAMFDGRYAELAGKVNADHIELRDLRNWRAGLLSELGNHFHPIGIVERIIKEAETDRKALHAKVDALEGIVNRRSDFKAS